MSWINEERLPLFQMLCIKILKFFGFRIPNHVAFIMDGNRRFAKRDGLKTSDGHVKGFEKLCEVLKWIAELGVKEVTVYAFSIENFKRPEEEVAALTELSCKKLALLLDSIEKFNKYGVSLRLVGRKCLLSDKVLSLFSRAMLETRCNDKLKLNIACAYTGRDEISRAASAVVDAVKNGDLLAEDIDEDLMSQTLELSEPDILIRTSGEVRLSDFMMWQVSKTVIYFTEALWPEFSFYGLLGAILCYNLHKTESTSFSINNKRKKAFLEKLEKRRWKEIESLKNHQ